MRPRHRLLAVLLALLPVLAACGLLFEPRLLVEPGALQMDTGSPLRDVHIGNLGTPHSVLDWRADANRSWLRLSPTAGSSRAGEPSTPLRISVDASGMAVGSTHEGLVVISSNGGEAVIRVSFTKTASPGCQPAAAAGAAAATPRRTEAFVPGQLLVGYREPYGLLSAAERAQAVRLRAQAVRRDHGLVALQVGGFGRADLVSVADPERAAAELSADPRVAYAHPNYYLRPLAVPDDPCYPDQWNLSGFGVPEAWELETGDGHEVVIAVIDSGVDVEHEELRGKTLPGFDVRDRDADVRPGSPNGYSEHGTHVAGIALAAGDNGVGVAGVAYGRLVKLLPVKVFGDGGEPGTTRELADAILWAAGLEVAGLPPNPHPADVINLSVGAGPVTLEELNRAAERARAAGALLVAAAGNNLSTDGSRGVQSPANAPAVLAIGSVDEDYERSAFSDWGADAATVDLMAPGGYGGHGCGRIRSTIPWGSYGCMVGTSMSTPFVAGVAALILSSEPTLGPAELEERLRSTTYFDPAHMDSRRYGHGVVCADRALSGDSHSSGRPCGSR